VIVIAIGTRADDWGRALTPDAAPVLQRPANTASIAQISGIPRESVRRKLRGLAKQGLVRRNDRGQWLLMKGAGRKLTPATDATIRYLVRLIDALHPMQT
jgi:hypothetical protein